MVWNLIDQALYTLALVGWSAVRNACQAPENNFDRNDTAKPREEGSHVRRAGLFEGSVKLTH